MFREARHVLLGSGFKSLLLAGFLSIGVSVGARATEPSPANPQPDVTNSLDAETVRTPKSALVLEGGEAGSILGKEVRSAADEKLGRIIDVIVDRNGATRAAVIDFGGFLGVGSRKIAVAWDILKFTAPAGGEDRITVQTTRDRLNTAPEFKEGKPITVLGAHDDAGTKVTLRTPER